MPRFSKSRSGFSLVEIVIAIGITAFTLAAIGGIFGVTNQSGLDSSRDTLMASMIGQVMSDLRPLPFDMLWKADPRHETQTYLTSLTGTPNPAPPTGTPEDSIYYFTSEGVLIFDPNKTPYSATTPPTPFPGTAVYRCRVKKVVDASTQSFGTAGAYNRLQLSLKFDWPVPFGGATNGPNVLTSNESISRYF